MPSESILGQSNSPGYTISGVVLDPSGAAVPEASVALIESERTVTETVTHSANGQFVFENISPGRYTVRVQKEDFKTSEIKVRIRNRSPGRLRIVLPLDELHEELTVYDSDNQVNTEISLVASAVTLDAELVENLPTMSQDVVSAVSGLVEAMSGEAATVIVDGLPVSDMTISLAEIKEIKINKDPYSAEYSKPGSGRVDIKTKGGSRKFHGWANYGFRDYRMDARNAFAVERPQEHHRAYGGNLSGPLSEKGKTTFSATFYRNEDSQRSIVNALGPSGPVRGNVPKRIESTSASSKIRHDLNDTNRLSIQYRFSDWSDEGESIGGFNLPETGVDYVATKHRIRYDHTKVFSPSLVNEFRLSGVLSDTFVGQSRTPGVRQIVVLDSFTGGGGQIDLALAQDYVTLAEIVSWSQGKHLVKVGFTVPTWSRRVSDDRSNFDGTDYFSSLEDFELGRPFTFVQNAGDSRLSFRYKELGWFVQDYIRLRPNLSVGLGLRHEWQSFVANENNFAPRFSVAYAPGQSQKTVIRAGFGMFYDHTGYRPISDVLRFDGQRLLRIDINDPGYPDPHAGAGSVVERPPTSLSVFDARLRAPYTIHHTVGVEHQLGESTTLSVTYTGLKGVKLFRSRDINASFAPFSLERPDTTLGVVRQIESSGNSRGHRLKFGLQGRLLSFFRGGVYYTLGHLRNDTGGIGSFPADSYDLTVEWGRSRRDVRHRFHLLATLDPGKLFNLGVVLSARSGQPYNITTGFDDNRDSRAIDRPMGVARNTEQGPGYFNLDLRWSRTFSLKPDRNGKKGPRLTLSFDAFNVLNRVNRSTPVGNLSSPFFGDSVSAVAARRLQIEGKIRF